MSLDRPLRRKAANIVFVALCNIATIVALIALGMIMESLIVKGGGGLDLDVFTKMTAAAGTKGGLLNAIVGSILMCGLAMIMAIVIGILAGTWLAEYGGRTAYGQVLSFLNDVLLSTPSILVGLFIYELLVLNVFHHYSGFAGSVALAFLAVPVITRVTDDILRLQPDTLREAGAGLGAAKWITIRQVIWKGANRGLLTGCLLAFARISGETAPLLFTALGNQFMSWDMSRPMASLPIVIFNDANSAYDDLVQMGWTAALLIAIAVLTVNIIGRALAAGQRK